MAATKKQLANLAKARAALKRKRKNEVSKKKKTISTAKKKRIVKKNPVRKKAVGKRKAKKSTKAKNYLYAAKSENSTRYYFTGESFDTVKSKAKPMGYDSALKAAKKYAKSISGYKFYWTGSNVKKPKGGGRKTNPVPPSSKVRQDMAAKLYEDFTGHECVTIEEVDYSVPKEVAKIGKVDGIMYTTKRDGKKESYIHEFKNSSRPTLAASYDGKKIVLVGGRYKFLDSGINDF